MYIQNYLINNNQPKFKCNPTEILKKNFIKSEKEIIDIFEKNPKANGIAGTLPPYWLTKLEGKTLEEKEIILSKIFELFRSAIKHLKPYNANKNQYKTRGADLENKRIKEVSEYLTKGLQHFGILPETNRVQLKRLKVTGSFTDRAYQLHEYGEKPSLEPLFIKKFKNKKLSEEYMNGHGINSELAHGLYLNSNTKGDYIQRFYWGDTKAKYIATEYVLPPKHVSPIVKLKSIYSSKLEFAKDFFKQTGIKVQELDNNKIDYGKQLKDGTFKPKSKEKIIIPFLQSILHKLNLNHTDLHQNNAIIGSTRTKQPIIKIIDVGGIY